MPLTQQAQSIIDAFGEQSGTTPQQLRNLQTVIDASPALIQQINEAVQQGQLARIVPLRSMNAAGIYDEEKRELSISPECLDRQSADDVFKYEMIFSISRQLNRARNESLREDVHSQFILDAVDVASSGESEHDYTDAIDSLVSGRKIDEGSDHIAGWNAVVSAAWEDARVHGRPDPALKDIYDKNPIRMMQFIHVDDRRTPPTYSPNPLLELSADHSIAYSKENLLGMSRIISRGSFGQGHHENSNLSNYFGAVAIESAIKIEREFSTLEPNAPVRQLRIDMTRLSFSPRTLSENGIDLGSQMAPVPYIDRSAHPPKPSHIWHTAQSHIHPPTGICLDHAAHPGHILYRHALTAVLQMNLQHRRGLGEHSCKLAGALAASAARDGLDDIHRVELSEDGKQVRGIQDDPQSPKPRTTEVNINLERYATIEQSTRLWQQAMHNRASPDQTPSQQAAPTGPQRRR